MYDLLLTFVEFCGRDILQPAAMAFRDAIFMPSSSLIFNPSFIALWRNAESPIQWMQGILLVVHAHIYAYSITFLQTPSMMTYYFESYFSVVNDY